jgi:uncharacterized membrane protein YraQ (UPF0718 family)
MSPSCEDRPAGPGGIPWGLILEAFFLVYAMAILIHLGEGHYVRTLAITFVGIVLEALPFMLTGALVGGFIEVFVSEKRIASILPTGKFRTVFLAAAMGMVFPVCECAIVPVIRRLISKGAPLSAAVAFLLGGPIVNPIVFFSTAVAYRMNWQISAIRLVAGYVIAVGIGFAMGALFRKTPALLPNCLGQSPNGCACCGHDHAGNGENGSRLLGALTHAAEDFFHIAHFLVIGAFVAASIQTTVDRFAFLLFAEFPSLSILMMALAVALNLCSEADAFVAASFQFTVPFSAQMAFMVLGPMLDLKLLFMYLGVFRKRAIVALSGMTVVAVFGAVTVLRLFMG